jgi:hypothetical protein
VVPVVVDGVAAVDRLPAVAGQEVVLRLDRAGAEAQREALVEALHLLQEHHIRIERGQAVAQLVNHHAAIEVRQPLMNVESDDPKPIHATES